jgi:hypothetical protein
MIALTCKLEALLVGVTRADLERMAPAERRRFAATLRRVADIADPPRPAAPLGAEGRVIRETRCPKTGPA